MILLAACTQQEVSTVTESPEDVLKKAALASQDLESAQYTITGDFDVADGNTRTSGQVRIDGILGNGGKDVRFQLDGSANVVEPEGQYTVSGNAEVVSIQPDQLFLQVHSLTVQPNNTLFNPSMLALFMGRWWQLPQNQQALPSTDVAPDPRILSAQSQVVTVANDRGVSELHGVQVRSFDVVLDSEKMIAYLSKIAAEQGEDFDAADMREQLSSLDARGQLWIDIQTYHIVKMQWVVERLQTSDEGELALSFVVSMRNHNAAPHIQAPEDATLFSPLEFLAPTLGSEQAFPYEDYLVDEIVEELAQ